MGGELTDEAVDAALATIPTGELEPALRWLARQHGAAAVPILRRCLAGRPERAIAAAQALGTLPRPEAAEALAATETHASPKAVRTAARRALYRLRQAGIERRPPAPPTAAPRIGLGEAWMSAVDGTGARGLWLTLTGPYGERTLLAAMLSDETGLMDFSASAIAKKRVEERLRALQRGEPAPLGSGPAAVGLGDARRGRRARARRGAAPCPRSSTTGSSGSDAPAAEPAPIHARLPTAVYADPALLERSAALLARPEFTGWFLDPASVASESVEWLQARESRLVVSDQIKAERVAALVDRIIETRFDAPDAATLAGPPGGAGLRPARARARRRRPPWPSRSPARSASPRRGSRASPSSAPLVERSLEIAGEVATGRLSAEAASRAPRAPRRRRRAAARWAASPTSPASWSATPRISSASPGARPSSAPAGRWPPSRCAAGRRVSSGSISSTRGTSPTRVHGAVLAGGSAFGLEACFGVMAHLEAPRRRPPDRRRARAAGGRARSSTTSRSARRASGPTARWASAPRRRRAAAPSRRARSAPAPARRSARRSASTGR